MRAAEDRGEGEACQERYGIGYDAGLPMDGSAMSSRSLRKAIGWDEEPFKIGVGRLVRLGRIEQPPNTKSLRRIQRTP